MWLIALKVHFFLLDKADGVLGALIEIRLALPDCNVDWPPGIIAGSHNRVAQWEVGLPGCRPPVIRPATIERARTE